MAVEDARVDGVEMFGYWPYPDRLDVVLARGAFARALVVAAPVSVLAERVGECRVTWDPDLAADLLEGVYWFEGVSNGPFILQVGNGELPGSALEVDLAELNNNHPLVLAWWWGEEVWRKADVVPVPRFGIGELVVTQPDGDEAVVRERKFLRGWSYTVEFDGREQNVPESGLSSSPTS